MTIRRILNGLQRLLLLFPPLPHEFIETFWTQDNLHQGRFVLPMLHIRKWELQCREGRYPGGVCQMVGYTVMFAAGVATGGLSCSGKNFVLCSPS